MEIPQINYSYIRVAVSISTLIHEPIKQPIWKKLPSAPLHCSPQLFIFYEEFSPKNF